MRRVRVRVVIISASDIIRVEAVEVEVELVEDVAAAILDGVERIRTPTGAEPAR